MAAGSAGLSLLIANPSGRFTQGSEADLNGSLRTITFSTNLYWSNYGPTIAKIYCKSAIYFLFLYFALVRSLIILVNNSVLVRTSLDGGAQGPEELVGIRLG